MTEIVPISPRREVGSKLSVGDPRLSRGQGLADLHARIGAFRRLVVGDRWGRRRSTSSDDEGQSERGQLRGRSLRSGDSQVVMLEVRLTPVLSCEIMAAAWLAEARLVTDVSCQLQ